MILNDIKYDHILKDMQDPIYSRDIAVFDIIPYILIKGGSILGWIFSRGDLNPIERLIRLCDKWS